ncbi:MAG: pyridoxal phosphate-dependent aminotransferase [Bacteroidales bacterium]|nr:pyridoxal phosphate-dependent aminotransferase [Bacteroidales bacterium]
MKDTPINCDIVTQIIKKLNIPDMGRITIRMLKKLVDEIEAATGEKFIRMEMGVPGLPPSQVGIEAEIKALRTGIAALYADIYGIPELKREMARFVKLFMNIDVSEEGCIPTVGSMQGGLATFVTVNRMYKEKNTTLSIDPCFPVHKQQHMVIGNPIEAFDVYNYRGDKLKAKLESYLEKGNISCILYSNPNNPSWICFTEKELKIIGEMATTYGAIIVEDLAYFGMDFRKDYSKPGQPPYQPSAANYTDNYILLISSSKVFSYAGQRIGMMVLSDKVYSLRSPNLLNYYYFDQFGPSMIFGTLYAMSAGTAHSPQYGLAAMLKAVNDGTVNLTQDVRVYGEKARIMKKLFMDNGFRIVYDMDDNDPVADGFYFTISYPEMDGEELIRELIYHGISAISLSICGSERSEGARACVSLVRESQFPALEERLKKFRENNPR